jgi:hypothetical protein
MTTWHPVLEAHEVEPGHWHLVDDLGERYGEIRFVRRGGELGYRADRCDAAGVLVAQVGYFRTLRAAAWETHMAFIRCHGAPPSRGYGK